MSTFSRQAFARYCWKSPSRLHAENLALPQRLRPRIGEPRQALAAQRLPQLQQTARLDLPNAFAGDAVGLGDLIQGPRLAVPQAEAQLDDLAFPRRQRAQHLCNAFLEQVLIDG